MSGGTRTRRGRAWRSRAVVWFLAAVVALFAVAWAADWRPGDIDRAAVQTWVTAAGRWGPLAVIALMTAAVVASPIPSAPIALASGAMYGHYAGTAYVAIGSEIGAICAFFIARGVRRGAIERWLGDKADYGLLGSQNALTLTVFVSRLMPFVSFDAMSYAAGLSCLQFWRFALATIAGILPASFLLAHFGSQAIEGNFGSAEWVVLGLGLATGLPFLLLALRRGRETGRDSRPNQTETHGA